jgi:hypothetical protein
MLQFNLGLSENRLESELLYRSLHGTGRAVNSF